LIKKASGGKIYLVIFIFFMTILSLSTIETIALIKIVFFIFICFLFVLLFFKKQKPINYVFLLTASFFVFYLIFSYKFRTMLWGNNGDEVFIMAFLSRVIHGQLLVDFYYSWLPPFYPPLYFWVTGVVASLFTQSAIVAHKIGVLGSLILWFLGTYLYQLIYFKKINKDIKNEISSWFWLFVPVLFLIVLDFDSIILKPYEALSALFLVMFISLLIQSFKQSRWTIKTYLFFGISAGLFFLLYYFWWFIIIPVIFILVFLSQDKFKNFIRVILLGFVALIIASIYLVPSLFSFYKYGIENWQALFFIDQDFSTFIPWSIISFKSIILIIGLSAFILFRKKKFVQPVIITFVLCYLYQLINYIYFIVFGTTFQPAKAFLFLASACLVFSAAYLIVKIWEKYVSKRFNLWQQKSILAFMFLLYVPFLPFIKFIDEPVVRSQMERDLETPESLWLAEQIYINVPDWKDRIWLSSGTPVVNAYIPLTYFIAHNPHFSHQAAQYSERMKLISEIIQAADADEFLKLINSSEPKINSLLLYFNANKKTYDLFFWEDNYPNGGKEKIFNLSQELVSEKYWDLVFYQNNWKIFLLKND